MQAYDEEEEAAVRRDVPPTVSVDACTTQEQLVWSFAYGANMNRSSLAKRHVAPVQSLPAVLRDYEFKFNMNGTMGNVQPRPGAEVHGIVHQLTPADMRKLEFIEGKGRIYDVVRLPVTTYDGQQVEAFVFVGMPNMVVPGDGKPLERYRNIILDSAREFGLHERHIAHIESFDYTRNRTPDQYFRFACPPRTPDVEFTPEQFEAMLEARRAERARDGGDTRTCVTLLGDRVLRLRLANNHMASAFLAYVLDCEGRDFAFFYCSAINEPSLSQARSLGELTDRHYAWVEDQLLGEASKPWLAEAQIIGYLKPQQAS